MRHDEIASVAVIGCGVVGVGWAALAAAHGLAVTAWDPSESVCRGLADQVRALALEIRGQPADIRVTATLADAVAGADLVQENAPERLDVKRQLVTAIESAADPHAIIASSTSSFILSEIAAEAARPERIITAHPFNPVHIVPLVELFGADGTVLDRADHFYRGLGKLPVRLKREAHGHIANRLSSALWREAVHLVAEGIADVEDVDAALVNGPGLRWAIMGAHMTYHLGGGAGGISHYLDHLGPSQVRRWAALGSPTLSEQVKSRIVAGVDHAAAGRSVTELERQRDWQLRRILAARQTSGDDRE